MANGKIIKPTGLESTPTLTARQSMKDFGLKICSMEKEGKSIVMEIHIKVNLNTEKGMEKESIFSRMGGSIRELGYVIIWRGKENSFGSMDACTKENGKIAKNKERVFFLGKMGENMKERTKTISEKEKESINGLMGRSTLGSLRTICGMVRGEK